MGGFSISSREQYIGRCRAYLSTAQTGVLHLNSTTLLPAHFKTEPIRMKRMIIFCMLFFCSSMVLTAASPRTAKYKQILKTIEQLETMVKDKDAEFLHTPENTVEGCLYTAVTCFKKGIQKLKPVSSQENTKFKKAIRLMNKFTYGDPGEVGFPHSAHNRDHCSLFSLADAPCNGGIVESKSVQKSNLPFITLEIKKPNFCTFGRGIPCDPSQSHACSWQPHDVLAEGQGSLQNNVNESCHY
ncbi:interleukin-21 isoform X1 [Corvus moneduloides]|uniref:interleukin-21 isoform X1 n=1 Tax=Corvus moneduloides TaxID=1196302 RepID=UPI0013632806|nr:interleukin-21 isoform X1 [Corvus moneduloides]